MDNNTERPIAYARNIGTLLKNYRSISYASEVGESARPIVPKWCVNALYAVSFCYVGVDLIHVWRENNHRQDNLGSNLIVVGDRALWHASASIVTPAVTIHTIVKTVKYALEKGKCSSKSAKLGATLMGLTSIPFIIHPIDEGTDWIMDKTCRKFYNI